LAQATGTAEAAGQYEPAGQGTCVAGVAQKEPARHGAPPGSAVPAAQNVPSTVQTEGATLDERQYEPTGHCTCVAGVPQKKPGAQARSAELPSAQ
jgi:hypothetical protein